MKIWLVKSTSNDPKDNGVQAVCTTLKKAIELVKSQYDSPECYRPVKDKCTFEEDGKWTICHIENEAGYYVDFEIEEGWTDDWLD